MPKTDSGRERARDEACPDPVCGQRPLCAVLAPCLAPTFARLAAERLGTCTGVSPTHYTAARGCAFVRRPWLAAMGLVSALRRAVPTHASEGDARGGVILMVAVSMIGRRPCANDPL